MKLSTLSLIPLLIATSFAAHIERPASAKGLWERQNNDPKSDKGLWERNNDNPGSEKGLWERQNDPKSNKELWERQENGPKPGKELWERQDSNPQSSKELWERQDNDPKSGKELWERQDIDPKSSKELWERQIDGPQKLTEEHGQAIKTSIVSNPMTVGLSPEQLQILRNMSTKDYAQIFSLPHSDFVRAMNDIGSGRAPTFPASEDAIPPMKRSKFAGSRLASRDVGEAGGLRLKAMILAQALDSSLPSKTIDFINGLRPAVFTAILNGPPQDIGKSMSTILSGKMPVLANLPTEEPKPKATRPGDELKV
ncbi:hypothetical protein ABW21_db0208262 [Orbilia brochopaga]|nr:hypothetical protein ABW21_db0208262 [Drechslerella brochopaga]